MRIALPKALTPAPPPTGSVMRIGGETMGTRWSALLAAPTVKADLVAAAIERRLTGIIDEMSHWEPSSVLSRFNRATAGSWHALPPDFATVIAAALGMAELSGGAFDPAIGRLVDLHGFGPPGPQHPPGDVALDEALAQGGAARLAYDPHGRRLRQPGGLALDLSGIAKGFAVDAVGAVLDGLGVADWLVEIGGELKGRGMRPDSDPWWVDLEAPPDIEPMPLRIALHGIAVATSGDYRRGAHTIDPRTGRAIASAVRSVSVIHQSAMWADAWATALTVLGSVEGMKLAAQHDVAAAMIVDAEELVSPALHEMLAD